MLQLGEERGLVVEAAQIEQQPTLLCVPDDGNRQITKRCREWSSDVIGSVAAPIAIAAPGMVSVGSEPLPVWLEASTTSNRNSSPSVRWSAGRIRSACV